MEPPAALYVAMRPLAKSAAYSNAPAPEPLTAMPVYDAPLAESSISVSAAVPSAPRQPAMVPPSVAKRKRSTSPIDLKDAPVLLNTVPVGEPIVFGGLPGVGGIVTTSA